MWDNFSSQTYKELFPSPMSWSFLIHSMKRIQLDSARKTKNVAPGYYRTPSLVSLWSSAPFLHNNVLGKFTGDPSVAGRMEAFNDAVEKLHLAGESG